MKRVCGLVCVWGGKEGMGTQAGLCQLGCAFGCNGCGPLAFPPASFLIQPLFSLASASFRDAAA